jgi:hypothetical protein
MPSRRDFQVIVDALRSTHASAEAILKLCRVFEDSNARFDRQKFTAACGLHNHVTENNNQPTNQPRITSEME